MLNFLCYIYRTLYLISYVQLLKLLFIAYDKNQNFGPTEQLESEFKMSFPDPSTYFDVNADSAFTGTALDNLVDYLAQYNKELDKQTVQRFYNERTIRYFRLSHQKDNANWF